MAKPSESAQKLRTQALVMAIDLIKAALSSLSSVNLADLGDQAVTMAAGFESYILNGLEEEEE